MLKVKTVKKMMFELCLKVKALYVLVAINYY